MKSNLFAGRLTPAARVEVHEITHNVPSRYAVSISFLSSDVKPELWYAIPKGMVSLSTGHSPEASTFSASNNSNFESL